MLRSILFLVRARDGARALPRDVRMSTKKSVVARSSRELTDVLGLSESDRAAIEVQLKLAEQITLELRRAGMTRACLARLAHTSRPRLTAILNGNLDGVSTDLLLRVLAALGVRVQMRFHRAAWPDLHRPPGQQQSA